MVLVLAATASCAPPGEPLHDWTIEADGVSARTVRLPHMLNDVLGWADAPFTLSREVAIAQPGAEHSLVIECFHGRLELYVDGVLIANFGNLRIGEHRFIVSRALTSKPSVRLELRAQRDWQVYARGFGIEPRWVAGVIDRPLWTARFNHVLGIVAVTTMVLCAALFAAMFLLDRGRRENAAAALIMTTVIVNALGWELGAFATWNRYAPMVVGIAACAQCLAIMYFVVHAFDRQRPPKILLALLAVAIVANFAKPLSPRVAGLVELATAPGLLAGWGYLIVVIWRVARRGEHRHDARLLLAGQVFGYALVIVDFPLSLVAGERVFGGLHLGSLSTVVLGALVAFMLARRDVARRRALLRNADELRHQVTERSRELADTLARLAAQRSTASGRIIDGRYRVIRTIGAGGMGIVFEAERLSDGKRVALKTLRGHVDSVELARFAREAEVAASLSHPNLVPVLDVGIDDGLFLVMPLLDGGSLATQRQRFGDVRWARATLGHIAAGLAALHARGVVHRDLKPQNVMIVDGTAKLVDFGLAAVRIENPLDARTLSPDDSPLTRAGEVFGTREYMAPELRDGMQHASPASDVYAFGVIARELLASNDEALRSLIERCLASDPAQRPTSDELARALS